MRLRVSTRFLAAITVLSLFVQPLAATADCWQMAVAEEKCPADCPMGHEPDSRHSHKAQAADPDCCEISSSEPTRQPTAVSSPSAAGYAELEPLARLPRLERPAAPALPESSPPRPSSSPLTALYCTFLI
jgi:hypothetical protein